MTERTLVPTPPAHREPPPTTLRIFNRATPISIPFDVKIPGKYEVEIFTQEMWDETPEHLRPTNFREWGDLRFRFGARED